MGEGAGVTITAKRKREMQAAGVRFGCFVNVKYGEQVEESCVKDFGDEFGCVHAERHRTREACPCWREIVEIKENGK
jgi:hypothetical protein